MIAAIRIAGQVNMNGKDKVMLDSLGLRKKYACIITNDRKMLEKVKDKITFGEISEDNLKKLISNRGRKAGDKPISEGIDSIISKLKSGKSLQDMGIKPFFRLHPPVKGFRKSTKLLYPRGVLGENEKINDLIVRMI